MTALASQSIFAQCNKEPEPADSWENATMLQEQFFSAARGSPSAWTGEYLLMVAVLQEGIHTYLKYRNSKTKRGRRLFEETRAWLWSREHHYLYAFERICLHLDLDPDYIRRGLGRWLQEEPQSPPARPASRAGHTK